MPWVIAHAFLTVSLSVAGPDKYHAKLGCDVNIACQVVDLMMSLLELHPLSPRPQPEISSGQPCHNHASAKVDMSSKPMPNEWQDIALVAGRACAILDWTSPRLQLTHPKKLYIC